MRRISDYLDGRPGRGDDPEEVKQAIADLDHEAARHFNYGYFELNLLSIFGECFSAESIRDLALRSVQQRLIAVWDGARRMSLVGDAGDAPRRPALSGWDQAALRRMLARGRGLILATAHAGPYRFIPPDLAMLGFDVTVALDDVSARTWVKSATRWNSARDSIAARGLAEWGTLSMCDVEQSGSGTPTLMKALRRNQIVLFFVDGNVGTDGTRGVSNRCSVRFLKRDTLVKTGVARLAIATDAGLATAFARRTGAGDVIDVGPCTTFPQSNARDDLSNMAGEWTKKFYATLEKEFLLRPAEWEGVKTFHRWRVAGSRSEEAPDVENRTNIANEVEKVLANGAVFHTKRGRVSMLNGRPPVLCDVDRLHGYKFREELSELVHRLHHGPGVDHDSVMQYAIGRDKVSVIELLATLKSRGLLDVTWHGQRAQESPRSARADEM